MVRCLVIVSMVAVSAAIFALPAAADKPTKYEYPLHLSGVITNVCSFPINVDTPFSVTEIDFVDASGALTKVVLHLAVQDTYTANGKTLVGMPFTWNREIFFDSSGNVTRDFSTGIVAKVQLPDGSLFISAGWYDFLAHPGDGAYLSPDKGNPGNIAGFCAALAP